MTKRGHMGFEGMSIDGTVFVSSKFARLACAGGGAGAPTFANTMLA